MIYRLTFLLSAKKEWDKLTPTLQKQFKKKLEERLTHPLVLKDKLSGVEHCYKIKLRSSGYRLVYRVIQDEIIVQVIAIGKRDKSYIYDVMMKRVMLSS